MKIEFRQGIISARQDSSRNLSCLVLNANKTVSLLASEIPLVLAFAYSTDGNFLVEIRKNIDSAWGPFNISNVSNWLLADIDLMTGALTFGSTTMFPVSQSSEPVNPASGQHWFDTSTVTMKVWDGSLWKSHIRLFIGSVINASAISYMQLGSQVGIQEEVDIGHILFDEANLPIRKSNGVFYTTDTESTVRFSGSSTAVKFDQNMLVMSAIEPIAAMSLINVCGPNQMRLADMHGRNAIGLVETDIISGSNAEVVFRGLVSSSDWSEVTEPSVTQFQSSLAGSNLWLTTNGKYSWYRPTIEKAQRIGTIINESSIFLSIESDSAVIDIVDNSSPVTVAAPLSQNTDSSIPVISILPATTTRNGYMQADDKVAIESLKTAHMNIADAIADSLSRKFDISGGTIFGPTAITVNPTLPSHIATKEYVDSHPGIPGKQGPRGNAGVDGGNAGSTGPAASAWQIISSVDIFSQTGAGTLNPAFAQFIAKFTSGTDLPTDYFGRFIVYESTDGSVFTEMQRSIADEDTTTYHPRSIAVAVKVRLFAAGAFTTLLEEQTIPVVNAGVYTVNVESTNGDVFRVGQPMSTYLIAHVYKDGIEITDTLSESQFAWRRVSFYPRPYPDDDVTWNASYSSGYKQIMITTNNVESKATFHCDISIPS